MKSFMSSLLKVASIVAISAIAIAFNPVKTSASATTAIYPAAKDVPASAMHAYVNSVIASCTKPNMTQEQKLKACYNYVLKHMKYKRSYDPGLAANVEDYALEAFFTGQGNCYRYASMFAYMAAELGYMVQIQAGQCTSTTGDWTPHSWVVITHPNGTNLIYDCSFGDSNKGKKNFYGITAAQHPRALWAQEIWVPAY